MQHTTLTLKFVLGPLHVLQHATLTLKCLSPQYLLNKLLKVQHIAARLVPRISKTNHISPHLASPHWLPIDSRLQYKFASLCYNCLNLTALVYLTDPLTVNQPTASYSLLLILPFCLPSVCTHSLGQRSFSLCCTLCLE